jgi:AAA domain
MHRYAALLDYLGADANQRSSVMSMFPDRPKKPHEVFTPRSAEVNEAMYISRPDLEEKLTQAIFAGLHVLIHGESGCGKSWLYKRVLAHQQTYYLPVNLAVASNLGSITSALRNSIHREGGAKKVGYSETKSAEAGLPGLAKGALEHTGQYEVGEKEPFEACLEFCRSKAGNKKPAFVVLDNLETIFSEDKLMKELGNLITLLDDDHYSAYGVRILIVGVPSGVREYFTKSENRQTIANRIREMPEVAALDHDQIIEFVHRGFTKELEYKLPTDQFESIAAHIEYVTMGFPQRLHEYCLELSFVAQRHAKTVTADLLDEADKNWLSTQLSNDFTLIQSMMNEKETRVGRRNQAIYALGRLNKNEFRNSDVEAQVRKEFPESTTNVIINVSQILSDLANRLSPIIKRPSSKNDYYIFTDPKYKMCVRAMLRKNSETHAIEFIDISKMFA